jgi:adenosylhomocysteine nucleosidase
MPKSAQTIFIHAALPCEARPLIEHYRLKKDLSSHAFETYCNGRVCLTVTGIGKCAMAAGVAYTLARAGAIDKPVMLNVGIAGHADHDLGRAFLADKIIDSDTAKNYYPPLVFSPPCPVETVRTGSRPYLEYAEPHLYDMEASAFYETATRFSTGELIQCLKVVSDNRQTPAEQIQPKRVAEWIAAQLPVLDALLAELGRLQDSISLAEPRQFKSLVDRFHFTANERQQLRNQLLRWDCLTEGELLDVDQAGLRSGKEVLAWLARQIDSIGYIL